jgi:hypothetical protein
MTSRRWPWLLLLLCAVCAHGAEVARLTNGFSLRCERHEELGSLTRLYLDAQGAGFIEVPSERVSGYEPAPEAPPQLAAPEATFPEHIARAGLQNGIDPDFIHSVIRAESGYNAKAISPKGAQGLMQLMPETAAKLGVRDSLDPANNIDGGSRYLRELLLRYNGDAVKALAAYNAGPESVEKYQGVPPYRETRSYVARVINDFNRRKLCPNKPQDSVCQQPRIPPQQAEPRRGPRLAASNPPVNSPVNSKDSKHTVLKGDSKPRQTGQRKPAADARKVARAGHPANPTRQASSPEGEESTRATMPFSARNQ